MFNKNRVRPSTDSYFVPDGEHYGLIFDAQEKQLPSKYHPSGYRDVLSIKIKVFHSGTETNLFYNVNWDWGSRRFLKTLEDLEVLPEPGKEFDLELLVNKEVMVTITNELKNGTNYSNIMQVHSVKPEDEVDISVFDQMGASANY